MEKKTYNYQQAYEASLKYFDGDELAARVWATKYALKDSFGNLYELTPDDMHRRIAREIAALSWVSMESPIAMAASSRLTRSRYSS